MPDLELDDLDQIDTNDPEAVRHLREAAQRAQRAATEQAEAANAAIQESESMKAAQHAAEVKATLTKLGAPEQIAELYPTDGPVDEDAVKAFLRDKVGIQPDEVNSAWSRYENRGQGEPLSPTPNEDEVWASSELQKNIDFYRRTTSPTEQEEKDMNDLKAKVFGRLNKWDQDVAEGRMEPIINPTGFGGFLDPPVYARRAQAHVTQGSN